MKDSLGQLLIDLERFAEVYDVLLAHYGSRYLQQRLDLGYLALVLHRHTALVVPGPKGRAWLGLGHIYRLPKPGQALRSVYQRRALEHVLPQGWLLQRLNTHQLFLRLPCGQNALLWAGPNPPRSLSLARIARQHPQHQLWIASPIKLRQTLQKRYAANYFSIAVTTRQLAIPSPYRLELLATV